MFYDLRPGTTVSLRIEVPESTEEPSQVVTNGGPLPPPMFLNIRPISLREPYDGPDFVVDWEPPSFDGGQDYVPRSRTGLDPPGYKVQLKRANAGWEDSAAVTQNTLDVKFDTGLFTHFLNLTEGVEYTVRVFALNEFGDGLPSEELTFTALETRAPKLKTAIVNGATLTLTYDEPLNENSIPYIDSFLASVNGVQRDVATVSVSGSAVILTLDPAVLRDDEINVSFAPKYFAEIVYATLSYDRDLVIEDLAGNRAPMFKGMQFTNNTGGRTDSRNTRSQQNAPATGQPSITGPTQVGGDPEGGRIRHHRHRRADRSDVQLPVVRERRDWRH